MLPDDPTPPTPPTLQPTPPSSASQPASPSESPPQTFRRFRCTSYWVTRLAADPAGVPIYDTAGNFLLKISAKAKGKLDLEGTGRLPDGTVINWTKKGSNRYKVLPAGWMGSGTGGRQLIPFKSVAVDQGNRSGDQPWKDSVTRSGPLIPVGTRIYVREFAGLVLPDGTTHDGWCEAADTGSAIYGAHFDWFLGDEENHGKVKHPDICNISFEGIEQIPADYAYGLVKVADYKSLRPPAARPLVA